MSLLLSALLGLLTTTADGGMGGQLIFDVTPSTAADPLTSTVFEVTGVAGAPQGANWLLLETVAGPHFSGLPAWFPLDAHADSNTVHWWSEYSDRHGAEGDRGSFTVRLSAWKGRNGTRLATADKDAVVHYDKSYTALRWNLSATPRGTPGTIRLTLTPANNLSQALAPQTERAWWFRYKYQSTPPKGLAQFVEDKTIEMTLEPPTFDLSLSLGGKVYFFGIFGTYSKGVSGGHPRGAAGFVSHRAPLVQLSATETTFQPLALIIPFANGTVPALPPGFRGPRVTLPAIPGDARLALHPYEDQAFSKVSMFDGGTIAMRLMYPHPSESDMDVDFIELELPPCMVIQNYNHTYQYTVVPAPSQPANGSYRVRLVPQQSLKGRWYYENLVVWLLPRIRCPTPSTQTVRIRALRTEMQANITDNWQEVRVSVVPVPAPPTRLPRRLAPSLAWANTYHFAPNETAEGRAHSIRMFRNVGMTTIPQRDCQYTQPSQHPGRFYTPEQRETELWAGLRYGPQISSFYHSFNGIGMFEALVMTQEAMHAFDPTKMMRKYGLSAAQIVKELALLKNALDFHNATGHIDVAYDGFFVANDLNVTHQIVEYTKPQFWFVDSEKFTPWQVWLVNVGLSKNAAARRKPGEADADLAYRMSKEFMTRYNTTVRDASDGATTIGFFAADKSTRNGVGSFPWTILEELGQLSQPGRYGQLNTANLEAAAELIAAEKRALGHGPGATRIIPWLSTGTAGPVSPTDTFNELIHMFLSGASGFCYFADIDFQDMEYYVRIAEAMRILVPFEDLIVDGALADIASSNNSVVSAMGLGGEFLIGVTPVNVSQPIQFHFRGNATGKHVLTNVVTNTVVESVSDADITFKARLTQTSVYRFTPVNDVTGQQSLVYDG